MTRRRMRTSDLFWNSDDWRRAWKTALMQINRVPAAVKGHMAFHQAIHLLDSAFVRGDALQFQLAILLLDCGNEGIGRGDYSPLRN